MKILILTEGGANIGWGHIMRCLSIFQALKGLGVKPRMIVFGDLSVKKLLPSGSQVFDWAHEWNRLERLIKDADAVVVDSYIADLNTIKRISALARRSLFIDDNARLPYPLGTVVNGTIYSERYKYPRSTGVKYLLGARYMPVRKEFWTVAKKRVRKDVKNILITFGGTKFSDISYKAYTLARQAYPDSNIVLISNDSVFKWKIRARDDKMAAVYGNLPAIDIKIIMLRADLAVSAGGQTLYELAHTGVPTIAIAVAKNQYNNVHGWEHAGFISYAGFRGQRTMESRLRKALNELRSARVRKKMSLAGTDFVDGRGAVRIAKEILERHG
jgi:UDP-2,4-diacetamido-2,4,6-trideoxy-beta-L-altropyranose hydrolase